VNSTDELLSCKGGLAPGPLHFRAEQFQHFLFSQFPHVSPIRFERLKRAVSEPRIQEFNRKQDSAAFNGFRRPNHASWLNRIAIASCAANAWSRIDDPRQLRREIAEVEGHRGA
jgi:hypothetical protein